MAKTIEELRACIETLEARQEIQGKAVAWELEWIEKQRKQLQAREDAVLAEKLDTDRELDEARLELQRVAETIPAPKLTPPQQRIVDILKTGDRQYRYQTSTSEYGRNGARKHFPGEAYIVDMKDYGSFKVPTNTHVALLDKGVLQKTGQIGAGHGAIIFFELNQLMDL